MIKAVTPKDTRQLVKAAGGARQLAEFLGVTSKDPKNIRQVVNNWLQRGLPAKVVLANQDKIELLRAKRKLS